MLLHGRALAWLQGAKAEWHQGCRAARLQPEWVQGCTAAAGRGFVPSRGCRPHPAPQLVKERMEQRECGCRSHPALPAGAPQGKRGRRGGEDDDEEANLLSGAAR